MCLSLTHFQTLSHRWLWLWLSLARSTGCNLGFSVSPKDTSNCQLCDKWLTCSTSEPHQPQGSATVSVCLVRFSIVMKLLALHISRTTHCPLRGFVAANCFFILSEHRFVSHLFLLFSDLIWSWYYRKKRHAVTVLVKMK